jgi:hypothetical protein
MLSPNASIAVVAVLVGIGGYAYLRTESAPAATVASPASNQVPLVDERPSRGTAAPLPMGGSTSLPPGHPPIGAGGGGMAGVGAAAGASAGMPVANDDPATLRWTAPATWKVLPNPSSMRLATYRVPRAGGDVEDTEVSVSRAGGTPDANIERWLGQFDNRGKETRSETTLKGIHVTVVDVSGTYLGSGMTPGAAAASHPGWALLAAIIQGPGVPYFVKITGPVATVRSARPGLDALLASLAPS